MAQTLSNLETSPSPARFPRHIAIIMDGNGRWARARKLPRAVGHRYGVDAVRRTVKAAIELSIPYLTLYSFSTENWSRPAAEVSDLLQLMRRYLQRDLGELHASGVRIKVIGQRDGVDRELRRLVDDAVALTANNRVLTLIIAFNYGGRDEIVEAARRIARDAVAGTISPEDVTAETIATALETSGIPDPDLLIRTSGELRLSNFLLWQLAYAELVFLDEYWPDFDQALLVKAIGVYQARERRFGGLGGLDAED